MQQAGEAVGVDVWDPELFFWCAKQATPAAASSTVDTAASAAPSSGVDLYASIAAAGLTFPEALVTTFVLSRGRARTASTPPSATSTMAATSARQSSGREHRLDARDQLARDLARSDAQPLALDRVAQGRGIEP